MSPTGPELIADLERPETIVAKVLKSLYPQNPDIVLGREGRIIVERLREAGFVFVPAKIEHKGPRAQVITPSDTVMTKEGQILAIALRAAEERELDYLAQIGRLEKRLQQFDGSAGA